MGEGGCQNRGNTSKNARPNIIQHHTIGIMARIGAAHEPWLPNVKNTKENKTFLKD
jgi:hypothetical protein